MKKLITTPGGNLIIVILFFCFYAGSLLSYGYVSAGELTKSQSWHHSVTEVGTIQVRMVTEYVKDGKVIDKKYGDPMTPTDTSNMTGWDQKSQDIVAAIIDKDVKTAFEAEHKTPTGVSIEEIVTYDRVVDDLGRISVRRITRIYDNGKEVSKEFHRSWIMPGQDASNADVISKALAGKLHTQAVIDAYNAKMAELAAK